MRKKLTPNQQAYRKEVARINRFIARAAKRGFVMGPNFSAPSPKRITKKAIADLKRLTPDRLYAKMRYVDKETGEVISGTKRRQQERSLAGQKARATRLRREYYATEPIPYDVSWTQGMTHDEIMDNVVIKNYRENISELSSAAYDWISKWLDSLMTKYGLHDVAEMLREGIENERLLTKKESYDEAKVAAYVANMKNYLPEIGPFTRDSYEDLWQLEDWPDLLE